MFNEIVGFIICGIMLVTLTGVLGSVRNFLETKYVIGHSEIRIPIVDNFSKITFLSQT